MSKIELSSNLEAWDYYAAIQIDHYFLVCVSFFTLLSYLFFTKIGSADIVCTLHNLAHYPYLFAPQKG